MRKTLLILLLAAAIPARADVGTLLPTGVTQVAVYGGLFAHPQDMYVQGCAVDFTGCTKVYLAKADAGGSNFCTIAVFPGMPTNGACFSVPKPAPVLADVCLPVIARVDVWSIEGDWGNVPDTVSAIERKWAVWRPREGCPNRKLQGRMGTNEEALALTENTLKSDADLNAWANSLPLREMTDQEWAFLETKKAALAAQLNILWPEVDAPPPPPPPGPKYVVAKNGTVPTRPVYVRTSDTAHATVEIGRVAVGDLCDATVKGGAGGFYGVAGRSDVAHPGVKFSVGAVSGCALAP